MADDIVTILRTGFGEDCKCYARCYCKCGCSGVVWAANYTDDAADEIERLREEVYDLGEHAKHQQEAIEHLKSIADDFVRWVGYQETMEHDHRSWKKPRSFFELRNIVSRYNKVNRA